MVDTDFPRATRPTGAAPGARGPTRRCSTACAAASPPGGATTRPRPDGGRGGGRRRRRWTRTRPFRVPVGDDARHLARPARGRGRRPGRPRRAWRTSSASTGLAAPVSGRGPVVVAPAPFKGALSAADAARAIAAGVRLGAPGARDAGRAGGRRRRGHARRAGGRRGRPPPAACVASDPLGRPVEAAVGELPGHVAVVELAQASGYERLAPGRARPRGDRRRGAPASSSAPRSTWAPGGSWWGWGAAPPPTAGSGLASALGVRALDADGRELEGRGADLRRVARIDLSGRDPRLDDVAIEVACDVHSPVPRPSRARPASTAPRRGPAPRRWTRLDAGLATLAAAIRDATGVDLDGVARRRRRRRRRRGPDGAARRRPWSRARRWCSRRSASTSASRGRRCA